MRRSPGLYTVIRAGKAVRELIVFLKNILNAHLFFDSAAYKLLKFFFNGVLYNKNYLVKACLDRIVNRIVKQRLAVFSDRLKLL